MSLASHLHQKQIDPSCTQSDFFRESYSSVMERIGQLTRQRSVQIPSDRKVAYSQYFSESSIARQMASMLDVKGGAQIGDHGAGTGILGATVIAKVLDEATTKIKPVTLHAYEIDELLHDAFNACLSEVDAFAGSLCQPAPNVTLGKDFTELASSLCQNDYKQSLQFCVVNPPYQKLLQSTDLAKLMKQNFVATPNLYVVFLVLSIMMLKPKGQMVAIVPRSFCSGDYFRPFRKWLKAQGSIDKFVRYKRRSNLFRGDNVLQENVIFRFNKGLNQPDNVHISLCESPECPPLYESMIPTSSVMPYDSDYIFVPADQSELEALSRIKKMPYSANDLAIKVTTGKFEDFRMPSYLYDQPLESSWAPVVYSQHWERGSKVLNWVPKIGKKPACLLLDPVSKSKVIARGNYVLYKRISANDDRKGRCHPCVLTENSPLPGDMWAIDNHVQVIEGSDLHPLSVEDAHQLADYLMTQDVDSMLRLVSGTTQINCNDILQLRFPALSRMHLQNS